MRTVVERQGLQPFGGGVVVQVVQRRDRGLGEVGKVHVAAEVVHRDRNEEVNVRLNQTDLAVVQSLTFFEVQRCRQRQFDGIGALVNPLFVERETTASSVIRAEGSVSQGQVGDRFTGHPNGVRGEIIDG